MISDSSDRFGELREAVRALCTTFPPEYWRQLDEQRAYPEAFVKALTEAGWLSALIPEEYGGSWLGITEASVILEEVNRSGGNSGACHAQMYIMGTVLRHGSSEQKQRYLPGIASGALRLQSFAVTEPTTGSDTTKLKTTAARKGDLYVVNGQKVWTSRVQHSDLMLLLARTTPLPEVKKKSEGLSVFLIDLRTLMGRGIAVRSAPPVLVSLPLRRRRACALTSSSEILPRGPLPWTSSITTPTSRASRRTLGDAGAAGA